MAVCIISGVVASLIMFIPYPVAEDALGISFRQFFISVLLMESLCVIAVLYGFVEYRNSDVREYRNEDWNE